MDKPYTYEFPPSSKKLDITVEQTQSDQPAQQPVLKIDGNILISNYNPVSDFNFRNIITKNTHKNILSSVPTDNNRVNNNFSATNSNSRVPNSKTRIEHNNNIITKNGPTKKPNIIVNNYNPDLIFASNNNNQQPHLQHPPYNINLNVKNDLGDAFNIPSVSASDRKSTCMLYLQADHTFFQVIFINLKNITNFNVKYNFFKYYM